jgi:hypothetical protein
VFFGVGPWPRSRFPGRLLARQILASEVSPTPGGLNRSLRRLADGQPVSEFRRRKVLDFSNNADMFASAMLGVDGTSLLLDVPARSMNTVAIR